MQSELNQRTRTVDVTISVDDVNETNWIRFMALPREARKAYLSDMINDGLENILYKNPEMLAEYISPAIDES